MVGDHHYPLSRTGNINSIKHQCTEDLGDSRDYDELGTTQSRLHHASRSRNIRRVCDLRDAKLDCNCRWSVIVLIVLSCFPGMGRGH